MQSPSPCLSCLKGQAALSQAAAWDPDACSHGWPGRGGAGAGRENAEGRPIATSSSAQPGSGGKGADPLAIQEEEAAALCQKDTLSERCVDAWRDGAVTVTT